MPYTEQTGVQSHTTYNSPTSTSMKSGGSPEHYNVWSPNQSSYSHFITIIDFITQPFFPVFKLKCQVYSDTVKSPCCFVKSSVDDAGGLHIALHSEIMVFWWWDQTTVMVVRTNHYGILWCLSQARQVLYLLCSFSGLILYSSFIHLKFCFIFLMEEIGP